MIPGIENTIKIKLFVDDTNLFLNKNDRLDHIQEILDQWCSVSGARFNIEKTEIIPIGTVEHRGEIVLTRKINPQDENPLPDKIHIAQDGDAVRVLGAWIGNKVNDITPWEPILDTVRRKLKIWEKAHPMLNGKCLIIQVIVGGHTQFLTKAQGMPEHIEKALTKIINKFLWDQDSIPRIAAEYLQRPIDEGGLNILDINSRNKAIEIIWLKAYLNFSPSCQQWATITDHIILAATPPSPVENAGNNPFLQTWTISLQGSRANNLNDDIRRMLKTARKYNANLATIKMTPSLLSQLPAWYHPFAEQKPLNNNRIKCLLQKHKVAQVADLVKISARICHPPQFPSH